MDNLTAQLVLDALNMAYSAILGYLINRWVRDDGWLLSELPGR